MNGLNRFEQIKKNKLFFIPPKIIKNIFSKSIWESQVSKILFTFDDGPNTRTTPIILNKLKEHSIKAIFFCVGANVKKYPELTKQIVNEGHIIGNHTMYHQKINFLNFNANLSIKLCSNEIENIIGELPIYFRPPYGSIGFRTKKILNQNGLKNVMWSLLTYDYKNDINIVKFAVDKYLRRNSIIVLHDSNKSKEMISESIDFIVKKIRANGYEIGEPVECLK